jgi:hypothetical protein
MPLIQTSTDSIKFTSYISKNKTLINFDSFCFNGQNVNNKTDIQIFVEDIENKFNLNNSNIGFLMLSFMRHNILETLMNKIESLLKKLNLNGTKEFRSESFHFSSLKLPNVSDTWTITINGIDELKYAEGLLFLYKNYVKPLLDELNFEIQDVVDVYYRFYYFKSNIFFLKSFFFV